MEQVAFDFLCEEAERLEWSVDFCEQKGCNGEIEMYAEFSRSSPEGEDFRFTVFYNDLISLVNGVKEAAEAFDVDEHIEMWIAARKNGVRDVPSTRTLVKDAEAIKEMMADLAPALIALLG